MWHGETLKQSFTFWSFANKGLSPEVLFQTSAEIGYQAVDLVDEALLDIATKAGLELSAHCAFKSIEEGLNDRANHTHLLKEFEHNLRLAETYKISGLICFSGNRHGRSDEESFDVLVEGLTKMTQLASDVGVSVWLELLNSKRDHPDYQCDRTAFGIQVIEAVNQTLVNQAPVNQAPVNQHNAKLLYDLYHMQVMEGDLIKTIELNHEHFGHYHTAGNPGRQNLDTQQEIYYLPIFQAIQKTAYTGYIAHEFLPKGDVAVALREAFDLCKKSCQDLV